MKELNNWYILKVIPNKEKQICEELKNLLFTHNIKVVRVISPTVVEEIKNKDKKVKIEKPLYRGYVYIETPDKLSEDEMKLIASFTFVMPMFNSKLPKRMSNQDVLNIIKDENLEKYKDENYNFHIDEKVFIKEGAFAGFQGVIKKIDKNTIFLNLIVFGRETNVDVSVNNITKWKEQN
jgi:transcriptional antiterminator NusG